MKCDAHGFYVPEVDLERCVSCGLCRDCCPVNHPTAGYQPQAVFAAWSRDKESRKQSSSGGIFSLLAKAVLRQGGVVFGVIYDEERELVCHAKVDNEAQLAALRGSKYVQSDVGLTYRQVRQELQTGRMVLFSGTPCQCAALKSFLGGDRPNLILVDLVCHGVPSPLVFSSYLKQLRKSQDDADILDVQFRNKSHSWALYRMQIAFASGTIYQRSRDEDPFLRSFLGNYCLRECCYNCQYAGTNRQGDITLGDFWGYQSEQRKYRNTDEGISLVLANTLLGQERLQQLQNQTVLVRKTLSEAITGNGPLRTPTSRPPDTDGFWAAFLQRCTLEDCYAEYLQPVAPSKKHKLRLWIDGHFYMLPGPLRKKYQSIVRRRAENIQNGY